MRHKKKGHLLKYYDDPACQGSARGAKSKMNWDALKNVKVNTVKISNRVPTEAELINKMHFLGQRPLAREILKLPHKRR